MGGRGATSSYSEVNTQNREEEHLSKKPIETTLSSKPTTEKESRLEQLCLFGPQNISNGPGKKSFGGNMLNMTVNLQSISIVQALVETATTLVPEPLVTHNKGEAGSNIQSGFSFIFGTTEIFHDQKKQKRRN
ncbi:hypothetical protein TorRG33x02_292560 [Trema orientale]|uniref:Uncharacterized protein n=1 Tax=Trema orientale TaxID=63057 RepID=A0A2P5CA20_TREOI|nr:hypothetical protein TorRG33x02_292560 [Trema orientale]